MQFKQLNTYSLQIQLTFFMDLNDITLLLT